MRPFRAPTYEYGGGSELRDYGDTLPNRFSAGVAMRPSFCPRCLSHAKPSSSLRASRFGPLKARESLRAVGRRPGSNPRAMPLTGGILSLSSRNSFPVIAEFFPLLRRTSFPVRTELTACSLGGECGFSAVSHPCSFRMRCGERRSAMPSPFENPNDFIF